MKILDRLSWPVYSYGLLFLCTFFQLMQWPLLPKFLDVYYHLSVMKGFADAGGYVTQAFWEYAPSGRAHLYPPVLHILMLFLYKIGFTPITIGRLVDCFSYPIFLFSFYQLMLKLHNKRVAFLSLLLLGSIFSLALASVTLLAFNLSMSFGLWALVCVEKRKSLAAGLLVALCFYTHTLGAWLILLTFIFYAIFRKEMARSVLQAGGVALFLAVPFLIYQMAHSQFFTFVKVHEFRKWEFDVTVDLIALGGLIYFYRKRALKMIALPLALVCGFLPLVITHPTRFFNGHGLMGLSILAAIFVDELLHLWQKKLSAKKLLAILTIFMTFVLFAGPFFEWDVAQKKGRWVWADRTIMRYLLPDEKRNFRAQGFSIFFPEDYAKIVEVIRAHSDPDDILWTDFSYTAGILGILADRATSCAMLSEVKPYQLSNRLKDARIIVWFKDRNTQPIGEMKLAVERYGFTLLKETEMAFIYKNPTGFSKRTLPKPLVPTSVLAGIFGIFSLILFVSTQKRGPC